jgi:arylsulfatase A-like enzyme
LSSTVDLAPTIIERAGLKPYWGIQGKSLVGNVAGSNDLRDGLVVEYEDTQPRMGFETSAVVRTLITADHRLTLYKGLTWGELYDRRADPDETLNLWDDAGSAAVRARLTEQLLQQLLENVDKSPHARRRA